MQQRQRTAGDPHPAAGYDQDFARWLERQAALLRARRFDLLDLDNLAEEVDAVAQGLHRELRNRIRIVLTHLLKYEFQPERLSDSWLETLGEQRAQIFELLAQNPSLRRRVMEYADRVYPLASAKAARETKLPASAFPASNPFTRDEILSDRTPP
jgi:UDP:flavonoid glycosyltransferase YjiC (YdhE family)